MRRRAVMAVLSLMSVAAPAAPPIVVSHGPDQLSVTFYRSVYRRLPIQVDPDSDTPLTGFVMIDEVRTVDLPPGAATVRFEGVASGITPQSAILFDTNLAEKNFDSRLLSQRGLLDAFTGQGVTVRRTDSKTGKTSLEKGTIVSRPDALLLRTVGGYEAVQCEGSLNTLLFPGVPLDLTAKPTLSLTTRADQPGGKMRLHLAYLADNFDWEATYVGIFAPDGQSLALTGWMTLASLDRTSFADAEVSAVAGRPLRYKSYEDEEAEREARENDPYAPDNIEIAAGCWPMGTTSAKGPLFTPGSVSARTLPPIELIAGQSDDRFQDIVVTARRRAERADLGDLKLYTVTRPTTVAAQSMKQVRFMEERQVKGQTLYLARYEDESIDSAGLVFRFRNRAEDGMGEPLPRGRFVLYQQTSVGRQLVGEAIIADKAVAEDVDILLRDSDNDIVQDYSVDFDEEEVDSGKDWTKRKVTVTNDHHFPITAEVAFRDDDDYRLSGFSQAVVERDGARQWHVEIPAESERSIKFRSTEVPKRDEN